MVTRLLHASLARWSRGRCRRSLARRIRRTPCPVLLACLQVEELLLNDPNNEELAGMYNGLNEVRGGGHPSGSGLPGTVASSFRAVCWLTGGGAGHGLALAVSRWAPSPWTSILDTCVVIGCQGGGGVCGTGRQGTDGWGTPHTAAPAGGTRRGVSRVVRACAVCLSVLTACR